MDRIEDIEAESDFATFERQERRIQTQFEETFYVAIEAERVMEEKPIGQETPEFGDGTQAFVVKMRDSIGEELYEELKNRYGDDQ